MIIQDDKFDVKTKECDHSVIDCKKYEHPLNIDLNISPNMRSELLSLQHE